MRLAPRRRPCAKGSEVQLLVGCFFESPPWLWNLNWAVDSVWIVWVWQAGNTPMNKNRNVNCLFYDIMRFFFQSVFYFYSPYIHSWGPKSNLDSRTHGQGVQKHLELSLKGCHATKANGKTYSKTTSNHQITSFKRGKSESQAAGKVRCCPFPLATPAMDCVLQAGVKGLDGCNLMVCGDLKALI